MIVDLAVLLIFPAAMAFAAAMDLLTMTIPNRVSLVLVAGFAALAPAVGLGLEAVAWHLATGVAMLVVGFVLFARGWIGGGDAKLFAATALWLGHEQLLTYAVVTALLGGVLATAILMLRMVPLPAGLARQTWIARLHNPDHGVPYGLAMAGAGLLTYPHSVWMAAVGA